MSSSISMDRATAVPGASRQDGGTCGRLRIGGEFEITPALLDTPPGSLPGEGYFATGRGALAAILRDAGRTRAGDIVLVPDYVCESVIQTVTALGLVPALYRVTSQLSIDLGALIELASGHRGSLIAVIFVDYFGLSACERWAADFKAAFPEVPVIKDCVQALFEMDRPGTEDYRFSSLRKWLPTPDGAPLAAGSGHAPQPTGDESTFVADKLLGNIERFWTRDPAPGSTDEAYVYLDRGEHAIEELGNHPARMSRLSRVILSNVDLDDVASRRRRNFAELSRLIGSLGLQPVLELDDKRTPHFLPIEVENRDGVRAKLREECIFCPVHWPRHAGVSASSANDLWEKELSLVIDQRYDTGDMQRLAQALRQAISAR